MSEIGIGQKVFRIGDKPLAANLVNSAATSPSSRRSRPWPRLWRSPKSPSSILPPIKKRMEPGVDRPHRSLTMPS